jgi:AbrB family looped-hinge helix DNA binding protein
MTRRSRPTLGTKELAAQLGKTQKQSRRHLRSLAKYDDKTYTKYEFADFEELAEVRREIEALTKRKRAAQAIVTSKGQLVIPAAVRRRYQIRKGTQMRIEETETGILLRPIAADTIDRVQGILANEGLPDNIDKDPDREIE